MPEVNSKSAGAALGSRILVYSVVDRRVAGGVQNVMARLLDALRWHGFAVTEVWATPGGGLVRSPDDWICPLYVRYENEVVGPGRRQWHLPSLARLIVCLACARPHAVNVHFVTAQTLYFLLLKPLFRYRLVLSVHGSDLLKPEPGSGRLLPRFLGTADAVTVVSANLADRVLSLPGVDPAKVRVIPNAVDTEFWTPGGPDAAADEVPTIVAVGRLEPVKGFDVLIEAFARVRTERPEARLCIIGDGPLREALEAQAEAAGVADAVEFTGARSREEVRARLRRAAVYALSSRSEGMPLALLEAMACGLPPVATQVGGVPEVLGEDAGLLVPPDEAGPLADAVISVLGSPDAARRLKSAALARAQDFSSTAVDAAYAKVFAEVLTTGVSPGCQREAEPS